MNVWSGSRLYESSLVFSPPKCCLRLLTRRDNWSSYGRSVCLVEYICLYPLNIKSCGTCALILSSDSQFWKVPSGARKSTAQFNNNKKAKAEKMYKASPSVLHHVWARQCTIFVRNVGRNVINLFLLPAASLAFPTLSLFSPYLHANEVVPPAVSRSGFALFFCLWHTQTDRQHANSERPQKRKEQWRK